MNVRLTPRALAEAKRLKTWWQQHRSAAPELFERELSAALERIEVTPDLGIAYRPGRFDAPVRRVLLPRTQFHVYYGIEEGVIVVLSVWGARQGREPGLP